MVEKDEPAAARPAAAEVPVVDFDALPIVNDDDDMELDDAVGFDEVYRVEVKRKLRGLQETCRAKRPKVLLSVAKAFTPANKFFASVEA